jgi:magnesium chelatase family protein
MAGRACRCTPDQVARYQGKLSGPLLDRIDLHIEVAALPADELLAAPPEARATAAVRGCAARRRADARAAGAARRAPTPRRCTAGAHRRACACWTMPRSPFLQHRGQRAWAGAARAVHRALKVARTIADLDSASRIGVPHLAEAMQYRRALPGA